MAIPSKTRKDTPSIIATNLNLPKVELKKEFFMYVLFKVVKICADAGKRPKDFLKQLHKLMSKVRQHKKVVRNFYNCEILIWFKQIWYNDCLTC